MSKPYRYSIIALAGIVTFFGGTAVGQLFLDYTVHVPRDGILVVDHGTARAKENGSPRYPFRTIAAAASYAATTPGKDTILVSEGTYQEIVALPPHTNLIASEQNVTITNDNLTQPTVTIADDVIVFGITVQGGLHNIFVEPDVAARLSHLTLTDAEQYGILADRDRADDAAEETEEESEDEEEELTRAEQEQQRAEEFNTEKFINSDDSLNRDALFALHAHKKKLIASHVRVTNSDNQGIYVRERWFELRDSIVEDSGEEGIDLHGYMYAEITNTIARNNVESGVETELNRNVVLITNSTFDNNAKNGINVQTGGGYGFVSLQNNTITNSTNFGLRCAIHSTRPERPRPYFWAQIELASNTITSNSVNIDPECDR